MLAPGANGAMRQGPGGCGSDARRHGHAGCESGGQWARPGDVAGRRPLLRVVLDRRGRVSDFNDAVIFRGTLEDLSAELYGREIQSFLMECGPDLAFNALRAGIIDKIVVFVAPKIIGGREIPAIGGEGIDKLSEAMPLRDWTLATSGPDRVWTAYVHRQ